MTIERNITLPSGTVYEGVSPMFIENGETIVTTVANTKNGAWLRTYNVYCGDIISESSHLGWGWRHVLFYNNFAPIDNGSSGTNGYDPLYSLVDVLTPHVRKELEFFDIASSGSSSSAMMELRTKTSKYTTHDIGSRIFDTGISGDLNGDGVNEAILLDENLQNLVSFQLLLINDDGGASVRTQEVWSLPLVDKLSSNIAAVSYSNEDESGVALAAASGNTVRVWISPSSQENALTSTSSTTTSPPSMASSPPPTSSNATSVSTDSNPTVSPEGTVPSTSEVDEESNVSNDEIGIINTGQKNSGVKNCSAQQANVANESRVSIVALALMFFAMIC